MSRTFVFFRNDDVNRMEPGLVETTDLLNDLDIPISHAVEPANLEPDTRDWLLARMPGGVEIIQHGYSHTSHDRGEFGGNRSAADQEKDFRDGLRIMEESFGADFFKAMSFPFGSYNEHSIPLLESLGYPVVSCHWRHQFSRQVYYRLGRMLRRGRWLDRHVSHHLKNYPGTGVREISVTIAPIAQYLEDEGPTACVFRDQDILQNSFRVCRGISNVVGVVLHHRYRVGDEPLQHLDDFARWLKDQPEVTFTTMEEIHRHISRSGG